MIKPTVGRVMWYWPKVFPDDWQPLAAMVAYVHSDGSVNIGYLDETGAHHLATSVPVVQDQQTRPDGPHVVWMPYQIGQAKKHEEIKNAG